MAVSHGVLTVAYLLIRDGGVYRGRGGDYFDKHNPARTAKKLTNRLEKNWVQVILTGGPSSLGHPEVCSRRNLHQMS